MKLNSKPIMASLLWRAQKTKNLVSQDNQHLAEEVSRTGVSPLKQTWYHTPLPLGQGHGGLLVLHYSAYMNQKTQTFKLQAWHSYHTLYTHTHPHTRPLQVSVSSEWGISATYILFVYGRNLIVNPQIWFICTDA